MAKKTFRTISMNSDLDKRLLDLAHRENQSASSLVRAAVERHLFKSKSSAVSELKADTVSVG